MKKIVYIEEFLNLTKEKENDRIFDGDNDDQDYQSDQDYQYLFAEDEAEIDEDLPFL